MNELAKFSEMHTLLKNSQSRGAMDWKRFQKKYRFLIDSSQYGMLPRDQAECLTHVKLACGTEV